VFLTDLVHHSAKSKAYFSEFTCKIFEKTTFRACCLRKTYSEGCIMLQRFRNAGKQDHQSSILTFVKVGKLCFNLFHFAKTSVGFRI